MPTKNRIFLTTCFKKFFRSVKMPNVLLNEDIYIYSAFGLNIASEICLPELSKGVGESDVYIGFGKVPQKINSPLLKTKNIELSQNELLFYIEGVGRFYAAKGREIIVEPCKEVDMDSIKLYLLGTALGTVALQRGLIPVHGSAIAFDGKCIIFAGPSGAGKSTLSSAFRKKGYPFISDDISVLTESKDGSIWVQPGFPQQKLCRDSIKKLGENIKDMKLVYEKKNKYAVPVEKGFVNEPLPLMAICEISPQECGFVEMTELFGVQKLETLIRNIYRIEFLQSFGADTDFFKKCLYIASKTRFFSMVRPKDKFCIEEQMQNILKIASID